MQVVRLSIPGNECVHCGTVITQELKCKGCGWVDPITISPKKPDFEAMYPGNADLAEHIYNIENRKLSETTKQKQPSLKD